MIDPSIAILIVLIVLGILAAMLAKVLGQEAIDKIEPPML
jgi:hypothetical protein